MTTQAFLPSFIAFVLALAAGVPQAPSKPARLTVTAPPRTPTRPGDVVVLTIDTPAAGMPVRVRAFDRPLLPFAVNPKRWRVLVGIDLDATLGPHVVTVDAGDPPEVRQTIYRLTVTPRRFRTRRLTVAEGFVNPPPAALERIEREAGELNALWAASSPERLWRGPFVRPVPDPANSAFGTRSILNGQPRSPHSGADFNSDTGTPVKAPNAGRVVLAANLYYTGNTVMIDHGLTLFSLFAHLSETNVREGDMVTTGEVVGKVGATGRVTGPHLHWSVRLNGARVDPLSLLSALRR